MCNHVYIYNWVCMYMCICIYIYIYMYTQFVCVHVSLLPLRAGGAFRV